MPRSGRSDRIITWPAACPRYHRRVRLLPPALLLLSACAPASVGGGQDSAAPSDGGLDGGSPGDGGAPPDGGADNPDGVEQVGGFGGGDDGDEDRLYVDGVGVLELELSQDEERDLERDGSSWTTATLLDGDARLPVGIRIKGSSTYTALSEKPSLKIDVNRVVPSQKFRGHKAFNLHNQILDPSFMSEHMSTTAYRQAGLPAGRVAYTRLWINGEDYGLYTVFEPPDRAFLRDWFGSDEGNLYENGYQDCEVTNPSCFDVEQDDLGDTSGLRTLAEVARLEGDAWREAMQALFDWQRFLDAMAMEALIAHWDGYAYDLSNYRLFHSAESGTMAFIPGSLDLDYGYRPWSYPHCGQYATDPSDYDDGVLALRCEQDETCHQELVDAMEALLSTWEEGDPIGRLDALQALIADDVASDPRAVYDRRDFEEHAACQRAWIEQRPDELRAWIAAQRAR
jgi:hypothetical protein